MGIFSSVKQAKITRRKSLSHMMDSYLSERKKLNRAKSQKSRTEVRTKAELRHSAKGKFECSTLVGRIVVTKHKGFIEALYPRFLCTDNVNDYRPEYLGLIYSGPVDEVIMERLSYVHYYIILRDVLDPDARENVSWVNLVGRHKIVRLHNVRDFITWFFPKQIKRIPEFNRVYAEQFDQFLNLVLSCIVCKRQLPRRACTEGSSPYPLFKIMGKSDWNLFVHTYMRLLEHGEPWKIEAAILTFLGRVMDGEVYGNKGGYNQLVKTAHKMYGFRVKKAVTAFVESEKLPELALLDLYYQISGADKSMSGISDDCGMSCMELGIFQA